MSSTSTTMSSNYQKDASVVTSRWFSKFRKSLSESDASNIMTLLRCVSVKDALDIQGNNLLHCVCLRGDIFPEIDSGALVNYLIRAGCDVNAKNYDGDTPLTCALSSNNIEAAKRLVDARAIRDASYFRDGIGPLHGAARRGQVVMVRMFLERGFDVGAVSNSGETPLHHAAKFHGDNSEIMKMLIEAGAKVNATCSKGLTPLHHAASNERMTKLLLSRGARVDLADKTGRTALHEACRYYNPRSAKMLIEAGADVRAVDDNGRGAFHEACNDMRRNKSILKLLLDGGVSLNEVDERGIDLFCYCIEQGCAKILELPFAVHVRSPLARYGNIRHKYTTHVLDWMETCIDYGAAVNRTDKGDNDPLRVAFRSGGNSKIVRFLLERGAVLDFEDEVVRGALESESVGNELPCFLISYVASFNAPNQRIRRRGGEEGPRNFNLSTLSEEKREFYDSCVEELSRLKDTRIPRANDVTFHDVLVDKVIGRYARNKNVIKAGLNKRRIMELFPIYADELIERFRKIEKNRDLVPSVRKGLALILGSNQNTLGVVIDGIMDHLDERDLVAVSSLF